jgi:sugar fermentation stimulation protein A
MQLPVPLHSAVLVRRYKRFLVDCTLADATPVTAHIADPGRLPGLVDEGPGSGSRPATIPGASWRIGWS